ncbi:hypothetical protein [Celeribacter indicus]|uniref:Uncharacterized protein n=1 Tax=Celeribacter indicus TaxID=1208324 RepID=A0A0B5E5R1_9RHOB|nr:hypothetical protein [Celeribacter indicus]AJE47662.1 hypothetical protein P73_2947 [Celeribacter indicus]SDW13549.1 hypothetical protein SAMN05443573_101508 [Celeribacter indicus]
MSFQNQNPFATPSPREGAMPVGKLAQLDEPGRLVVTLFRGSEALRRDSDMGRIFSQMMMVFDRHGRRPLMRHGMGCDCLGADEAVLAQFVRLAAQGAREDATLMAMLLVRGDMAPLAVSLAEQLGLTIRQTVGLRPRPPVGMAMH